MLKKRAVSESSKIVAGLSNIEQDFCVQPPEVTNSTKVISTGSTLLDLAITGTRRRGGGVPGGIIVEVFGPSGSGKTAVLAEMAAYAQARGGDIRFDDPEARLDREYSEIYGMKLQAKNYNRPDTVRQMFQGLWDWEPAPKRKGAINLSGEDSLAALSTEMEMEDQDKMGMKRAKDFSEGLRKTCRLIANKNWLIVCTNQEREGTDGHPHTPGGKGIPYYSSLRIRITPMFGKDKIFKSKTINKVKHDSVIGIRSICEVKKSSIDVPYRKAPVFIVFGVGIDDVRGNLTWMKENTGATKYVAGDKEFAFVEDAISHVEENNLESALRETVIDTWESIQRELRVERKRKLRE